ncbi:hypothetical protein E2C01_102626 [Portunus trituberculatus]|uniref:Uncharacterized protein n=1 Tax=Portunus trituberculatus TaxID=210409 RepID=A0A5B7KN13_PORTR|nr:hypothetical protein [Portunus trituberculatus]
MFCKFAQRNKKWYRRLSHDFALENTTPTQTYRNQQNNDLAPTYSILHRLISIALSTGKSSSLSLSLSPNRCEWRRVAVAESGRKPRHQIKGKNMVILFTDGSSYLLMHEKDGNSGVV